MNLLVFSMLACSLSSFPEPWSEGLQPPLAGESVNPFEEGTGRLFFELDTAQATLWRRGEDRPLWSAELENGLLKSQEKQGLLVIGVYEAMHRQRVLLDQERGSSSIGVPRSSGEQPEECVFFAGAGGGPFGLVRDLMFSSGQAQWSCMRKLWRGRTVRWCGPIPRFLPSGRGQWEVEGYDPGNRIF
jgi:hypothetical protein